MVYDNPPFDTPPRPKGEELLAVDKADFNSPRNTVGSWTNGNDAIPPFLNQNPMPSVITVEKVTVTQGRRVALYPTTCTLTQGRTMVILGATGSGKDSFYATLVGVQAIADGQFLLNAVPVPLLNKVDIQWRKQTGMGRKNFLPITPLCLTAKTLYKRPWGRLARYLGDDVDVSLLRMVGIYDMVQRPCKSLSKWQWVRALLVRAVTQKSPFVAVNWKHFRFLDGKQKERLRVLLKQLQQQYGFGLIVNTDDATLARAIADDVIIFNRGLMEQSGDAQTVYRNPVNQFVMEQFSDGLVNVFQGGLTGNSKVLLDNGLTLAIWGVDPVHTNKEIHLCIRPEDFMPSAQGAFVLNVAFVEQSAACQWVYGYLSPENFKGIDSMKQLICVHYTADKQLGTGDRITLSVAQENLYLLDAKTGQPLNQEQHQ